MSLLELLLEEESNMMTKSTELEELLLEKLLLK